MNAAIMSTVVARKMGTGANTYTVRSPLASFVATAKDRAAALTRFTEMHVAYSYAQLKHSQTTKVPGRPSKNYDAHLHIQVQATTKAKFDAIAVTYNLSQSETLVFLLDCLDILKDEFIPKEEMDAAEQRVLDFACAGKQ